MLAGSLNEFALPDVFALLASTRKTGVLNLTGAETDGRVWIVGGELAYAVADVTRSQLAARLLHSGEVDPSDVAALVHAQATGNGMQMAAALAGVGVPSDRATGLLYDQVVDAAFDLSRWVGGSFGFDAAPNADVPDATPTYAAERVMSAVASRMTEWDGIVATLPSPASVLRPVPRPPTQNGVIQILPEQWEVLTLIDGLRTVGDIIQLTGQGQFVVAKLLSALVEAGLVQLREDSGPRTITQQRAAHLSTVEHEVLGAPAVLSSAATGAAAPQGAPAPVIEPDPTPSPSPTPQPSLATPTSQPMQPTPAEAPSSSDDDPTSDEVAPLVAEVETDAPAAEPKADETDEGSTPADHADPFSEEDQRSLESILSGHEAAPAAIVPAPDQAPTPEPDEDDRIRELAALGLSLSAGETAHLNREDAPAAQVDTPSTPDDDDLLARLIDGVKGA